MDITNPSASAHSHLQDEEPVTSQSLDFCIKITPTPEDLWLIPIQVKAGSWWRLT